MKLNEMNGSQANAGVGNAFKQACVACCQKILAQLAASKAAIFAEAHQTLGAHEHLLQLALNEAEAVAAQTKYPHLVFPTLATEKVRAIVAWDTHQRSVRRSNPMFALAA